MNKRAEIIVEICKCNATRAELFYFEEMDENVSRPSGNMDHQFVNDFDHFSVVEHL